jgi:hypothetical protein
MKTNSIDLLELTPAESPWRSWLLRSWIIGSVLLTSFCVFKGLEASSPPKPTTRQITITEEVRRTKRMDEVRENDFVLARDEYGTEIGPRRVVQVHRRMSDHLRLLTFEARDGTQQIIKTTDEHPFGSADSLHFIPAGQLPLGHQVPGPKGERQTLVATAREEHPEGVPVFNFEVEGFHTYFVSAKNANSLLVHNNCDVVYHGTDDISARSIQNRGLSLPASRKAAGGAGVDPKGFSVTTDREVAEAWAKVRAAERGGNPVVLQANAADLPLQSGSLSELCDPNELFIRPGDFPSVGPGVFTPTR